MKQGRKLRVNKNIITELEADTRLSSDEMGDTILGLDDLEQYWRANLNMDLSEGMWNDS